MDYSDPAMRKIVPGCVGVGLSSEDIRQSGEPIKIYQKKTIKKIKMTKGICVVSAMKICNVMGTWCGACEASSGDMIWLRIYDFV